MVAFNPMLPFLGDVMKQRRGVMTVLATGSDEEEEGSD